MKREQQRSHEHLDGQLKKAEEALRKERAQTEAELATCSAETNDVLRAIETTRDALTATADSVKDLAPEVITKLVEEYVMWGKEGLQWGELPRVWTVTVP